MSAIIPDSEITRLCAEATDDAQAMALVKRFSINIHHHGCADAKASLVTVTGHWQPFTEEFKVVSDDLNRAIRELVAKMWKEKS
jgi:hypothetical protein